MQAAGGEGGAGGGGEAAGSSSWRRGRGGGGEQEEEVGGGGAVEEERVCGAGGEEVERSGSTLHGALQARDGRVRHHGNREESRGRTLGWENSSSLPSCSSSAEEFM